MATKNDYEWIEKWGRMMGSRPSYIWQEQARAAAAGAPLTAIYEMRDANGPTGKWATIDDITNLATRRVLGLAVAEAAS
jgi:hypothetical protein